jgi:antirestriction protein ArdC
VLAITAADRGWSSSTWATYQAWQRHGGQVRRGERGTHVVLWKPIDRRTGEYQADDEDGHGPSLFARTFTVFAAEQIDGTDPVRNAADPVDESARLDLAERYLERLGASVVYGGDVACYVPATDVIRMPEFTRFEQPADFYSTAAHEHVHWTGHRARLDRDLSGRFGDRAYGAEELIAELGAAFWCAQFQLEQATRADHAAYLGDWLSLLRQDARALVAACGQAQRAIDYLNTSAGWPDAPTPAAAASG